MDFQTWPPVLVVDVEGNGATPPDLIEVAIVPVVSGRVDSDRSRTWLIRPPRPITRFASRVHGISDADVAGASTWAAVASEVQAELDGNWIAAHNAAAVEYRVLKAHLPDWEPAGVIDTLRLGRAVYASAPRHTLDTLITQAGIDTSGLPGNRHRAGFDAAATALLLLDLASHLSTFSALIAAGVPSGLPGGPGTARQPDPEAQTLW